MSMFPLGALPMSSLAGLASRASPTDLLQMARENPALVAGLAGQVQRNPRAALDIAGSLVKKNAGRARGAAAAARGPAMAAAMAARSSVSPVERAVMRINRPPETGRFLRLAQDKGQQMLSKY